MEVYKVPDQHLEPIDRIPFSNPTDSIFEEPFESDVFNDPELTYREHCDYFLNCSYEHLLQNQWYQLATIFSSNLDENVSLSCLCIVLRNLTYHEKQKVLPLERIKDAILARDPNEVTLTLASEIADMFPYVLITKEVILTNASSELGEYWVRLMRSEYKNLKDSLTTSDFERLLPLDERGFPYRTAVLNFFKIAMEDFEYCRIIYIQEISNLLT
jgi:hypothetical protein